MASAKDVTWVHKPVLASPVPSKPSQPSGVARCVGVEVSSEPADMEEEHGLCLVGQAVRSVVRVDVVYPKDTRIPEGMAIGVILAGT